MMSSFLLFSTLLLCGIALGCFFSVLAIRFVPYGILKSMGLIITFPCTMIALFIFVFMRSDFGILSNPILQGILNSPLVVLPCVARYLSLPTGAARSAIGLGATPILRFQKLWLPLLAVPLLLSVVLTAFILILYRAFW